MWGVQQGIAVAYLLHDPPDRFPRGVRIVVRILREQFHDPHATIRTLRIDVSEGPSPINGEPEHLILLVLDCLLPVMCSGHLDVVFATVRPPTQYYIIVFVTVETLAECFSCVKTLSLFFCKPPWPMLLFN